MTVITFSKPRLAPSRTAFHWRGSVDAITWTAWRHLCFEHEVIPLPTGRHLNYVQVRVVKGDQVIMTSQITTWSSTR